MRFRIAELLGTLDANLRRPRVTASGIVHGLLPWRG